MKFKNYCFFSLTLIFTIQVDAQYKSTMAQAKMMNNTAEKFHIDYRAIDQASSEYIFNTFLNKLDKFGLFFSTEDTILLSSFKFDLGKQIQDENASFLTKVHELYLKNLDITLSIITNQKSQPLDLTTKETFYYKENRPIVTRSELENKWKQWLKFMILDKYYSNLDSSELLLPLDIELAKKFRDSIIDEQNSILIDRKKNSIKLNQRIADNFLSAIARSYDPHTDYLSPNEKDEFNEMLSSSKFSFGISLVENDRNEIEIKSITPGSTAWNSGEINEGDILLSVRPLGQREIDFKNMSVHEVELILMSEKTDDVLFKIKKQTGKIVTIELYKSTITVDENIINSYVIHGEKKIGYISLPSFYFNRETDNGCANDIAKELIQLKKEGIEGLIFDIRGNGGGSMEEAIKLCGMFINYGALLIFKSKEDEPETIKDLNKGSVYTGPMIVLVDKTSCSASEVFAAVMQDYNRALIIGNNTYGKSTSQTIAPINASVLSPSENVDESLGFIKLTMGKLYRCTGKSYQKEGVQVDISIPDMFEAIEIGEKLEPRVLENKPIDKKTYFTPLEALPITQLKESSRQRLSTNQLFSEKIKQYKSYATLINNGEIPVSFEEYMKYRVEAESIDKSKSSIQNSTIKVTIPDYILSLGKMAESNKKIKETNCQNLEKDYTLIESNSILNEFIQIQTK